MKEMESTAVRRAPEAEDFGNRKLIRPTLTRPEGNGGGPAVAERRERPARKPAPVEQTHAENFYYQKQMQSKTPMVVVLKDGEEIRGYIEWYDKNCLKITRASQSNLLVYKQSIKYLFKESEGGQRGSR